MLAVSIPVYSLGLSTACHILIFSVSDQGNGTEEQDYSKERAANTSSFQKPYPKLKMHVYSTLKGIPFLPVDD